MSIAGPCTDIPLLAQLATIAVVFVLAFPLPSRPWRGAVISASRWPQKTWWFRIFHEEQGSWVFAALNDAPPWPWEPCPALQALAGEPGSRRCRPAWCPLSSRVG